MKTVLYEESNFKLLLYFRVKSCVVEYVTVKTSHLSYPKDGHVSHNLCIFLQTMNEDGI